jgi:A/G-specific adenine glycosylase
LRVDFRILRSLPTPLRWRQSMPLLPPPSPYVLLAWYDRHARALPWRVPPGATKHPEAYLVWLSEIMLQQTTVAAVARYYERFIARWPTIEALAAAALEDVLAEWAGLGYYARARSLHACAREIVETHGGRFPSQAADLKSLPGIGLYTAGAIAAIAFGRAEAAIDGNAERVIARLFAVKDPLPGAKARLRTLGESLVPADRPGDFAQAVMDLGATLCSPRRPACALCPWAECCRARGLGIAESLPVKAAKRARPVRRGAAFVLARRDGAILLRRRAPKGLLGGMLEVPTTEWLEAPLPSRPAALQAAPAARWRKRTGLVTHTFTHFYLELEVYAGICDDPPSDGLWAKPRSLDALALPSLMRKVIAAGLPNPPSSSPARGGSGRPNVGRRGDAHQIPPSAPSGHLPRKRRRTVSAR